ncbi:MAG: hypothetical protein ABIH34_02100 [Nanoarchaeota archaeon]
MPKLLGFMKQKDAFIAAVRHGFDKHPLTKFISLIVILIGYFLYTSFHHGVKDGFLVSFLTWSFFVLCTPVVDAGLLIDFPMRLITGMRMIFTELIVWVFAIMLNFYAYFINPSLYDKSILLSLFKHILDAPFPYGGIILLSFLGTYLSVYLADSIVDPYQVEERHITFLKRYRWTIFFIILFLVIALYDFLLNRLGVNMPLL